MKAFVHENLFKLDGDIPVVRAIPYGIQHILAMFVANLAPILIVGAAAGLADDQLGMLVQSAMLIAGIGTLIQLFPLWRVGSGLPIVMGISFTFVTVLVGIAATYGYNVAIGAIIVGGIIEGVLGLFAKYWRRIISPIVAAVVVTSIGFSPLRSAAAPALPTSDRRRTCCWAPSRWFRAWCSRCWRKARPSSFRCCSAWSSGMHAPWLRGRSTSAASRT